MSAPVLSVETLKNIGLTSDQIAALRAAAAQITGGNRQSDFNSIISSIIESEDSAGEGEYGRERHDELTRHLDRILNAPAGLKKFSTDPINRAGFRIPSGGIAGKQWRSGGLLTSKSLESLLVRGGGVLVSPGSKENGSKRTLHGAAPNVGLKKARSSDALRDARRREAEDMDDEERDCHLPRQIPAVKRELYAWAEPVAAAAGAGLNGMSAARRFNLAREQDKKQEAATASATSQRQNAVRHVVPLNEQPADLRPQGRASFSRFPTTGPFALPEKQQPRDIPVQVPVQAQAQSSPEGKQQSLGFSLMDLIQELESAPVSATSSMNVQLSTPKYEDKYGSLYELGAATEQASPCLDDGIQSEPAMHYGYEQRPLSACTDLSGNIESDLLHDDDLSGASTSSPPIPYLFANLLCSTRDPVAPWCWVDESGDEVEAPDRSSS